MEQSLEHIELFVDMTPEEIERIQHCLSAKQREYKKGQIVLVEGAHTNVIGAVISGKVIIERTDVWGNKNVLYDISPGGIFAETYACVPEAPLLVNAIAVKDSTILLLHAKNIHNPCEAPCSAHMKLIKNLITLCARKNIELSNRVLHTSPKTIRKRVMSYLTECAKTSGSDVFEVPYNRQQLADYLNVERSALCNELSLMQKDGLISYERNIFTVL